LLPYAELAAALKLRGAADTLVAVAGEQGWTDGGVLLSLMMLNLAGGGCVEDLETLGADPGFQEMLRHLMTTGLTRSQRRRYRRRFRRGGERAVPSARGRPIRSPSGRRNCAAAGRPNRARRGRRN